jgi:hypothetical protein
VQDSIHQVAFDQAMFCMMIGCVLAAIVAAALSRSGQPRTFGILPRLLLAGCPTYFGVDYLVYQGSTMVACAAASFAFILYCLRGWWHPERLTRALMACVQSTTFRVSRRRQRPPALASMGWWRDKIFGLFGLFLLSVVLQNGWPGVLAVIMGVLVLAFVAVVINVVWRLCRWAKAGSLDTHGNRPRSLSVTVRMRNSVFHLSFYYVAVRDRAAGLMLPATHSDSVDLSRLGKRQERIAPFEPMQCNDELSARVNSASFQNEAT